MSSVSLSVRWSLSWIFIVVTQRSSSSLLPSPGLPPPSRWVTTLKTAVADYIAWDPYLKILIPTIFLILLTKWRKLTRDAQTFVNRSFSLSRNKKKSQLFVAHSFWVIYRNVSRTLVELCMSTPYWSTILLHQYGRRKSTKTSGVHLFYKRRTSIRAHKYIF